MNSQYHNPHTQQQQQQHSPPPKHPEDPSSGVVNFSFPPVPPSSPTDVNPPFQINIWENFANHANPSQVLMADCANAVRMSNWSALDVILNNNRNFDVNQVNALCGGTLLGLASRVQTNLQILMILMKHGSVFTENGGGLGFNEIFGAVVSENSIAIVQFLRSMVSVEDEETLLCHKREGSLLHLACKQGNTQLINWLVVKDSWMMKKKDSFFRSCPMTAYFSGKGAFRNHLAKRFYNCHYGKDKAVKLDTETLKNLVFYYVDDKQTSLTIKPLQMFIKCGFDPKFLEIILHGFKWEQNDLERAIVMIYRRHYENQKASCPYETIYLHMLLKKGAGKRIEHPLVYTWIFNVNQTLIYEVRDFLKNVKKRREYLDLECSHQNFCDSLWKKYSFFSLPYNNNNNNNNNDDDDDDDVKEDDDNEKHSQ